MPETPGNALILTLLDHRDRFLRFLEPRVAGPEAADEILQAAFVKAFERASEVRERARAGAWFYRLLRNTLADHYRHQAAGVRAVAWKSRSLTADSAGQSGSVRRICECWKQVLPTMKPEAAELLRKVDLEGLAVVDVAKTLGITPNSAMVRLYRARQALRARLVELCGNCTESGCLDCHCAPKA